jgi:quercetin dioxygenase-like cupin family protein
MANHVVISDFTKLRDGYLAPNCTSRGGARSALFQPSDYSLWQLAGELDAATELEWRTDHGDEALYVVDGEVEIDGTGVSPGGAVLVEAGAPANLRALKASRVAHFGPVDHEPPSAGPFGAPGGEGRHVHVFPTVDAAPSLSDPSQSGTYFGDGSCSTCRIAFFVVDGRRSTEGYTSASHTHSEDEIIHVLDGEMHVGPITVRPGMSIAVRANRRYGFRTPAGFRFVNYRRDAATMVRAPDSPPILETVGALREMISSVDGGTIVAALD